jgi:membrane peptidoglycan carboxypeptidase
MLASSILTLLLIFGLLGGAYAAIQVPLPAEVPTKQVSTVYFSDGKTPLAGLGVENRTDVPLSQVPKHVQHAIVAAEDRSFYENSGISPKGIARAVWSNVKGDEVQGGSTITQQYVKNAHLTQERTFSRKMKEVVLAVKADRKYSKDQILEFYLNTIYFGEGAYGIKAAAATYFHKDISTLTVAEGAVLAAVIKAPAAYNPNVDRARAEARWKYVLDGMVSQKWLSAADRAAQVYPRFQPPPAKNTGGSFGLSGARGVLAYKIVKELEAKGFDEQEIRTGGLRIITTIDAKMQAASVQAVEDVLKENPGHELTSAMVAVEPGTGKVRAYYGGNGGYGSFDLASARHQPGSSFKAYALAAAVADGISIKSYWDGSTNQKFPGESKPVKNSDGESCGRCNLIDATRLSLNTTFYAVTAKVGVNKVVDVAKDSGITSMDGQAPGTFSPSTRKVALGEYGVSVLDHADGYATFAANGLHAAPYFVDRVDQAGNTLYSVGRARTNRAFSADIAADATYAMQSVYKAGKKRLDGNRPAAAKTGTAQYLDTGENAHAWMCGFTPQLATAVWMGHTGNDGPLRNANGSRIYGSGLPRQIWTAFMNAALEGTQELPLPEPKFLGDETKGNESSPSPTPSPSESDSPSPDPSPEISSEPSVSATPSSSDSASPSSPAEPGGGGNNGGNNDGGNNNGNNGNGGNGGNGGVAGAPNGATGRGGGVLSGLGAVGTGHPSG